MFKMLATALFVALILIILSVTLVFPRKTKIHHPLVTFSKLGSYGRIGNQIFQVMATKHIAANAVATAVFPVSASNLPLFHLLDFGDIPFMDVAGTDLFQEKDATTYTEFPGKQWDVLDLEGYFQHIQYLQGVPMPRLQPKFQNIASHFSNHVGIHVRRGDYLTLSDSYVNLPATYFHQALTLIPAIDKVVVCSDDIEWCKANLQIPYNVEFSQSSSELEDFATLAGCKAMVMSNSTFSWWTAQFGSKSHVVVPWPWFKGSLSHLNSEDALIMPDWTVLNVNSML